MNLAQSIIAAMPTPAESIKPRWATVTSMDPLRVRFDGEENPLALTPINLANAKTEDRVWTMTFAGQVFIVGRHRAKAMGIMYKTDGDQATGLQVAIGFDYAHAVLQGGMSAGPGGSGKGELIVPRTGWYQATAYCYLKGLVGFNVYQVATWTNGWDAKASLNIHKTDGSNDQSFYIHAPVYLTKGSIVTMIMSGSAGTWGGPDRNGTFLQLMEL